MAVGKNDQHKVLEHHVDLPKTGSQTSIVSKLTDTNTIQFEKNLDKWSNNVDKRYAWVILFALFTMMSTTLGSYRIFGLIYAKIVKDEVYTREEASWPVATIFTIENCVGPIVSMIVYYFSIRQSLFIGSLFLIAGNGLAYFSNTLIVDILLLGVIQGLGYGFIFMPMMEIVNSYFVVYRTIAFGVALTGGTAAIFVLTPLFQYVLEYYSFRVAYAVIGGICCINLIMVPLLRPNPRPKLIIDEDEHNERSLKRNTLRRASSYAFRFQTSMRRQSVKISHMPDINNSMNSISSCPTSATNANVILQRPSYSCPIGVKDNLTNQKQTVGNLRKKDSPISAISIPENSSSDDDEFKLSMFIDVIKNPAFHLIWYNELIFFWVFSIYCLVAVDYAIDRGLNQDEAQSLLQFWSGGEIIGRLILTILVDMKFVSNKVAVLIVLMGLTLLLILVTFISSYIWYASITIGVAALNSLLYILINGLLVEYLGEQHVTLGYGMASCIDGLLMSIRPTAVGYFRDFLGSYDYLMIAMASMCLLGVVLWILEPLYAKKKV